MTDMTDTIYDPNLHPRNVGSGRYIPVYNSAPESSLEYAEDLAPAQVRADVEAVTHGIEELEKSIGAGRFDWADLDEASSHIWQGVTGHPASGAELEEHINTRGMELTAVNVTRLLEVTYQRAASGRYHYDAHGALVCEPVDEAELRAADREAEHKGNLVTSLWEAGETDIPDSEISAHNARLFAEHVLQSLRAGASMATYPRLVEFANTPYSEAAGTSERKIDALHAELSTIRAAHDYLSPRDRVRLDTLQTFAMHGHIQA